MIYIQKSYQIQKSLPRALEKLLSMPEMDSPVCCSLPCFDAFAASAPAPEENLFDAFSYPKSSFGVDKYEDGESKEDWEKPDVKDGGGCRRWSDVPALWLP